MFISFQNAPSQIISWKPLFGQVISDNMWTGDGESKLTPERQKISNTSL